MRTVSRRVYVDGIPVPLGVRKGFADVDNRADTKSTSIRLPKRGAPFNPLLPLPEVRDNAVVQTEVVLRALGESLSRNRLYVRSIEVHRRLVILVSHDCVAHYNLACGLARQAATREAIEELGRALDFGYDDFGHLDNDPDLDSLRKLPAYRKLVRQHGIQS